jgi:hypothetical protein
VALLPLLALALFAFSYYFSQQFFVKCEYESFVQCKAIDSGALIASSAVFLPISEEFSKGADDAKQKGREILSKIYTGRLSWMFLATANVLFCVFSLWVFWSIARQWSNWKFATVLIIVAAAIGFAASANDSLFLAKPLFKDTIQAAGRGGIANFTGIIFYLNALLYTGAVAMALVVALILFNKTGGFIGKIVDMGDTVNNDRLGATVQALSKQQDHLKTLLYVSTILLIIGVLRLSTGYTWALYFLTPETAKSAEGFFNTLTTTIGGFFTMLLAAIYLPTAYIIHKRAQAVIQGDKSIAAAAKDEEMEKKGFKFSVSETLPRLLAILAPFLTGPIADLLKNVAPK